MTFLKWFLQYVKALISAIAKWLLRYPIATLVTFIVIFGGVIMLLFGQKIAIGGIIAKLFGSKNRSVRGVVPTGRVDSTGKKIPIGKSDKNGFVEAPISHGIKKQGFFSNPDTVTIIHPDKGKVVISLPKGVKNSNVEEVVEIKPDVYEIKNNDSGKNVAPLLKDLGSK